MHQTCRSERLSGNIKHSFPAFIIPNFERMRSADNYQQLITKLDGFTRKYYVNQLLRGGLIFIAGILGLYLLLSLSEWEFYFPSAVRKVMFFGFIGAAAAGLARLIIRPALKLNRLGKRITHEQAATIIGKHFSEVEDKLLNILQLQNQAESHGQNELVLASIDQKSKRIAIVPFASAIRLSENRRYLKYALPPLAVLLFFLFAAPDVLRDGTKRIISNSEGFEKQAPFQFMVNTDLSVVQFDDFELQVNVSGRALPPEVLIQTSEYQTRLQKSSASEFTHTFKSVQGDIDFQLSGGGFNSSGFKLKVIPKPMIVNFEVLLDYPAYIGKKDETLRSIGDLVIPVGTKVKWNFNSRNASHINLVFGDGRAGASLSGKEMFTLEKQVMESSPYRVIVSNEQLPKGDSIGYNLAVIPDLYPTISVQRFEDSMNRKYLYFLGDAADDYGVSGLAFRYKVEKAETKDESEFKTLPVKAVIEKNQARFTYSWDVNQLDLTPGDKVLYYFMVWDNDGVHGAKATKTALMTFDMPTIEEYKELNEQSTKQIKDDLKNSMDEARQLKEEVKSLREKLLQKQDLSWEDKRKIEELMDRQENLQKDVQDLQNKLDLNLSQQKEFKQPDERIAEKQQRLQELFNEMLTEEMKKLFEELEKLLEELNKKQTLEELENFELSNEQLEHELDRMLELFKQLEFEQKMLEAIEDLKQLAEEQEELSQETDGLSKDEVPEAEEKQSDINEKFEDLQKELQNLEKMNSEMQFPNNMEKTDQQQQSISEEMQNIMEQLQKKQMQKASGSQKNASEQMKKLAEQLESMMSGMEMEQMMLDMQAIRQLLDNLIRTSFDQEGLMYDLDKTIINTPQYSKMVQEQHKIRQNTRMIEDSLQALSMRVAQISSFVNKEITEVNRNMAGAIDLLAERRKPEARSRQQYVMTGMNNLALMLDEVMQAMQQQMSQMMPGNQMCQSPNSGQSMKQMGQMQQQLNQQIQDLKGQMKDGSGKGQGPGKMSKELAELAAKQAALRKALQQYSKENSQPGGSNGNLDKLADEMEKTEEDLVNKRLTHELLERQKEIMIRLLEAEKAEREREISPERESKSADEISRDLPPSLEEYLKKRQADIEWYKTVPPSLKPFYRKLVESYFESLD